MKSNKFISTLKAIDQKRGYLEILSIAVPMILTTASWSLQHFIDRMFLSWYSAEAIAASMPAGMLNFCIVAFFMGTAGYTGTFISQYCGAKKSKRIGPALWQGIYFAIVGWLVLAAFIPLAPSIFTHIGHAKEIIEGEIIYFQLLSIGAGGPLITATLSTFFSGRGKTVPVMWINFASVALNLLLDYVMIFGHFGFPELGIKGAGIATAIAGIFGIFLYIALIFRPSHIAKYQLLSASFERELFIRLVTYGVPAGFEFFMDTVGFALFIIFTGTLGTIPLAASNIAFNINTVAFMPMIGAGISVSVLTGKYIGAGSPEIAEQRAYSTFHLAFGYMSIMCLLYLFFPSLFIEPFVRHLSAGDLVETRSLLSILVRFVAAFSIFDALNLTFNSALKGAGDTKFTMRVLTFGSLCLLIIPGYILFYKLQASLIAGWTLATIYIMFLGITFFIRFRTGKWKTMKVIEDKVSVIPVTSPDIQLIEHE